MTQLWYEINQSLSGGHNPYAGFPADPAQADAQGWNSDHPFLADTIASARPRVVVEVGVWKGASSIRMAQAMKEAGIDSVIIAVDTFLGSWDHYVDPTWLPSLKLRNGYPTLFYTFLTNVRLNRLEEYIQPLPLDSANASVLLGRKGIRPDAVHIDAGHDFEAVSKDLRMWWELLQPGGTMILDDYDEAGVVWPSVGQAVDAFLQENPHEAREAVPYKIRFRKPA